MNSEFLRWSKFLSNRNLSGSTGQNMQRLRTYTQRMYQLNRVKLDTRISIRDFEQKLIIYEFHSHFAKGKKEQRSPTVVFRIIPLSIVSYCKLLQLRSITLSRTSSSI
jgi:hypothetical protein